MSLETDLAGAVSRGEIVAYYQPQFDVESGRIVAVEALSRWQHPVLGLVSPLDFIPIAEETGLIEEIGEYMVDQGLELAALLGLAHIEVAVNVSALQLVTPDFTDHVIEGFQRLGLQPEQVTIELTESRPVADIPSAIERLEKLRDLGIGISIDDFGRGHSSLKQLEALPFTELKIDQELVRDDTRDTWSRLSSLLSVVRSRGLRVVAEGIETQDQLDRVRQVGCDRAQGYYLGMPMTRDEVISLVAA